MLDIRLFGGFSSSLEGQPLVGRAGQRKRQALLALLAAAPTRSLSRDKLLALLWPDSDTQRARHQLTTAVYDLRKAAGEDVVVSAGEELRLGSGRARADLWEFERLLASGDEECAVALYKGPFLDGFFLTDAPEFERWVEGERERLARALADALGRLAAGCEQAGDFASAAVWWRELADHDPYSSRTALALMQALRRSGDPAGALRHAWSHTALLRDELGIAADAEVEALTARLRAELPGHPPGAAASLASASAATSAAHTPPAPPVQSPPAPRRRAWIHVALAAIAAALVLGIPVAELARDGARGADAAGRAVAIASGSAAAQGEARAVALRARIAWDRRTEKGLEEAIVLFRRATELDPENAEAHAGLAESYVMLGYHGFAPEAAVFPKARAAALRALRLDPSLGPAYAALGQALAFEHAWAEAEQTFLRGIESAPDYATIHQWYALLLSYLGRSAEAALHTSHAARLEPLSVQINNMHGMMLYYAGDLEGALRQYELTVDVEPDSAWIRQNPWVLSNFGRVAAAAGRTERALSLIERAVQIVPTHPRPLLDLAYAHLQAGDTITARAAFARADTAHTQYAAYRAGLHALFGEHDEAYAWLDRVDYWPLPTLATLTSDPRYDALRADPRYDAIRERLGMPPARGDVR